MNAFRCIFESRHALSSEVRLQQQPSCPQTYRLSHHPLTRCALFQRFIFDYGGSQIPRSQFFILRSIALPDATTADGLAIAASPTVPGFGDVGLATATCLGAPVVASFTTTAARRLASTFGVVDASGTAYSTPRPSVVASASAAFSLASSA